MQRRYPALITKRGVEITGALVIPSAPKRFIPSVMFLIDTGADVTNINEIEIGKLDLNIKDLPRTIKPVLTWGGRTQSHVVSNPVFLFFDEQKQSRDFIGLNEIHATEQPTEKGDRGKLLNKFILPNLLGRDFFIKFKLKFVVDFGKQIAFIEE
jgi:hypothetical protein